MVFKSLLLYGSVAAVGAGIFYLATRDVKQGAKLAQRSANQFRQNIKTMKEWAEEGAEKVQDKVKDVAKKD